MTPEDIKRRDALDKAGKLHLEAVNGTLVCAMGEGLPPVPVMPASPETEPLWTKEEYEALKAKLEDPGLYGDRQERIQEEAQALPEVDSVKVVGSMGSEKDDKRLEELWAKEEAKDLAAVAKSLPENGG